MPSSHSEAEELREYWVRVRPFEPSKHEWQVLVPIQLCHAVQIGVGSQAEFPKPGPGEIDYKAFFPQADRSAWTFSDAQRSCEDELLMFKEEGAGKSPSAYRRLLLTGLDQLAELKVRKAITAPGVKPSQRVPITVELDVPDEHMDEVLEDAKHDVTSYLFMYEYGLHCMLYKILVYQPSHFQQWFHSAIAGANRKPGRAPEIWNLKSRNLLIFALVESMVQHGLTAMRNEASDPNSACDALAKAAVRVKLPGVKTYESVRKVYSRERAASKAAPSVKLRKQSHP